MPKFKLNIEKLNESLLIKSVHQKEVADYLKVSNQAVSDWFLSKKLPEPHRLKKLCEFLNLNISDVIVKEPTVIYNFKLPGKTKQKKQHDDIASDMSICLEQLIPYINKDIIKEPIKLFNPENNYIYIQRAADSIRSKISKNNCISEEDIKSFIISELNTIIVPVMWGEKKNFCNALQFTYEDASFLYINLNSKKEDFKFWLLHEIAHLLAPHLDESIKEEFANQLAGAILIKKSEIETIYKALPKDETKQMSYIYNKSLELDLHQYTIYKQIESYILNNKLENYLIKSQRLYNLNSKDILGTSLDYNKIDAKDYISIAYKDFKSNFFNYLKKYLKDNPDINYSFIIRLLNIHLNDAIELFNELTNES